MVAAPTSLPARGSARERIVARVDAAAVRILAGLVLVSFAARLAVGWLRATPNYFADEYLYAELARSLAEQGRPLVRGIDVSFPALLQPLVTAPAWLVDDVWLSYRLTQGLGALAMSLAAVPVFLLGKRLGLGASLSLAAAALALAIPDLLFASWVVAEPFAYPLALAAVLSAVATLAGPSRRGGLAFVVLAALAAFARVQFAVLPLCFLAALLVVGARERRLRAAFREQALPLGVFAGAGIAALAVGLDRVLGVYRSGLDGRADPVELAERVGLNALVLAYASGWILVPGALVGLALAIGRPRSRTELAFGALFAVVTTALLLEAALAGAVEHAQERYVFYALPLAVLGFCLYASRGWPARTHLALVASGLVAATAQVPLAGFTAVEGKAHSPFLIAAYWVEEALGSPGSGSLAVAAAAGALLVAAIVLSSRPRIATPIALGLALAACVASSAGAIAFDNRNSLAVRQAFLPADPSWVDRTGVSGVILVRGPHGVRTEALEQLFWNRSVDRVALLPGAGEVDHFQSPHVVIGPDGRLLVAGKPVRRPLLVDGYAGTIRLADAARLAESQSYTLWRPRGDARLSLYLAGRYSDGWLSGIGRLYLWPDRAGGRIAGRVRLALTAPVAAGPVVLRFQAPGAPPRNVRLSPGVTETVTFDVCARGRWHLTFVSNVRGFVGGRVVSVQAAEPEFRKGRVCAVARPPAAPAAVATETA